MDEAVDEEALREFRAGIAFWKARPLWPADLHSADYEAWARDNPDGRFTDEWWQPFLRRLHDWIAVRPVPHADVTERFVARRSALTVAWQNSIRPYRDRDITTVAWTQVREFPDLVGEIKPMKMRPSPVFTSKFCHFLMPRVFPVVDNEGSGGRWTTYEDYFRSVQQLWSATSTLTKRSLAAELQAAVTAGGGSLHREFPLVNKIVELRLIGRNHS